MSQLVPQQVEVQATFAKTKRNQLQTEADALSFKLDRNMSTNHGLYRSITNMK